MVAGGTNGFTPTLDHLLDLKKEIAVDSADVAISGFFTNTKVESVLAKAKDSENQYLLSLLKLNLAVARLLSGVLSSGTTSPQTFQRVLGPTSRLLFTGTLQTC